MFCSEINVNEQINIINSVTEEETEVVDEWYSRIEAVNV